MGESRYTPVEGREMPDSAAGGHSAQTLKSLRRSLYGEVENRISVSRRASRSNLGNSASVYPSPRIRKSTLVDGSPFFSIGITLPGALGTDRSTNMSFGSTWTVQISRKALSFPRFFRTIFTGPSGVGKRNDSLKVRFCDLASSVVSHSP